MGLEKRQMVLVSESGDEETGVPLGAVGISSSGSALRGVGIMDDSEVGEKAIRRKFTAAYKIGILKEADACRESGQLGALLRREGLYSSHLTTWRRQRDRGTLEALSPRKRGPKVEVPHPLVKRVETLEKENQQLRHQLKQAETIIEVQKKISEILHLSPDPRGEKS